MAYSGFVGDGYLGNFPSTSALEAAYPSQRYAGRKATVETAGVVSLYFSTGAGWSVIGSGGVLPTFSFQAETLSAVTAMTAAGSTPNSRRQKSQDRMIKRLKDCGAWAKMSALYVLAADSAAQALINLRNPGTNNLTVTGSPVFTQFQGYTFPTIASYLSTGIAPSTLDASSVSMGCFTNPAASLAGSSYNMGSTDAGGGNGISLLCTIARVPASGNFGVIVGSAVNSDQGGLQGTNRNGSTVDLYHLSRLTDTNTSAPVAATTVTNPITIGKVNGRTTTCLQQITGGYVGTGMTQAQMEIIYAAVQDYIDKVQWGDIDVYEAGFQPAVVTAQHICYSTKVGSIAYAIECKRRGESVIIVGDWRDRSLGGMSANGLNEVDNRNIGVLGGIAKTFLTKMRVGIMGVANNDKDFTSIAFRKATFNYLDPARAEGFDIPVYWSNGIASVAKTGLNITSITTVDGRTFIGEQFHDGGYEGDLLALSGASFTIGREAIGTGFEVYSGNRSTLYDPIIRISPRVVENDDSSALLPDIVLDDTAQGAADDRVSAYNFRQWWTQNARNKYPFAATPPPGYSASNYELMGRLFVAQPTMTLADCFILSSIPKDAQGNMLDVNNRAFVSSDLLGNYSRAYTKATTYAQREVIWKQHEAWIRGMLYWLQYSGDARIPASIPTDIATYAWEGYHGLDPHPNDSLHWMGQMYIREMRRMIGDVVWTANDIGQTDGTVPRITDTAAVSNYEFDNHASRRLLVTTVSPNYVTSEPGIAIAGAGGTNVTAPLPIQLFRPKAAEVSNLTVSFCASVTHTAFGSTRMENTAMQAGQACAVNAILARQTGVAVQAVPYANIRTALQTTADAVQPYLPQVN